MRRGQEEDNQGTQQQQQQLLKKCPHPQHNNRSYLVYATIRYSAVSAYILSMVGPRLEIKLLTLAALTDMPYTVSYTGT